MFVWHLQTADISTAAAAFCPMLFSLDLTAFYMRHLHIHRKQRELCTMHVSHIVSFNWCGLFPVNILILFICILYLTCVTKEARQPQTHSPSPSPPGPARGLWVSKANSCLDIYEEVMNPCVETGFFLEDTQKPGPVFFGPIWKTAVDFRSCFGQPGDMQQWSLFHCYDRTVEEGREAFKKTQSKSVRMQNSQKLPAGCPLKGIKMCVVHFGRIQAEYPTYSTKCSKVGSWFF